MADLTRNRKETEMENDTRQQILGLLVKGYNMELETVINYLTNSIHLDGMLATEVKESLAEDLDEELGHARQLAQRIKVLGGKIPGSLALKMQQASMQPPESTVDIEAVIRGVIEAEDGAITNYQDIIDATDGVDPVTQDLAVELKGDEEEHRREFVGFLREYESMKKMFGK